MTVRREVQKWSSLTVRDFQESGNRDIIGTPGGITPTGVPVIVPDIFFGDTSRSGGYMKEIFIRKLSLERVRNLPHIEIPLSEEKTSDTYRKKRQRENDSSGGTCIHIK